MELIEKIFDFDPQHFKTIKLQRKLVEDEKIEEEEDIKELIEQSYSLLMLHRYEESIEYAERALAIDPKNLATLQIKSQLLYYLKQYTQAYTILQKALQIDPTNKYAKDLQKKTLDQLKQ